MLWLVRLSRAPLGLVNYRRYHHHDGSHLWHHERPHCGRRNYLPRLPRHHHRRHRVVRDWSRIHIISGMSHSSLRISFLSCLDLFFSSSSSPSTLLVAFIPRPSLHSLLLLTSLDYNLFSIFSSVNWMLTSCSTPLYLVSPFSTTLWLLPYLERWLSSTRQRWLWKKFSSCWENLSWWRCAPPRWAQH